MRRFWIGLLTSVVGFLVLWNAFFAAFGMQIFANDFALWKAKFDLVESSEAADVVILGDSGAISALGTTGKRRTLNLALPCAGPVEAKYIYDRYLRRHPPPKILVVEFAEFNFRNLSCLKTYGLSFGFLSFDEKLEILRELARSKSTSAVFGEQERLFEALKVPLQVRHSLFIGLNALHLTPYDVEKVRDVLQFPQWRYYVNDYQLAMKGRGHFVIGVGESSDGVRLEGIDYEKFEASPANRTYLEKILVTAQRDATRVLVRFDPANPASAAAFSTTYRTQVAAYFDAFRSRFPNANFESFMRTLPASSFGDADLHMNARGSRLETDHLEAALDELER